MEDIFFSPPGINCVFCQNRDHSNWSLDDGKDDRFGQEQICNFQLFTPIFMKCFLNSDIANRYATRRGNGDFWTFLDMADHFLVHPCVSLLCLSHGCLSVGKLLALIIITVSSGMTALWKGVLHPGAREEESLVLLA